LALVRAKSSRKAGPTPPDFYGAPPLFPPYRSAKRRRPARKLQRRIGRRLQSAGRYFGIPTSDRRRLRIGRGDRLREVWGEEIRRADSLPTVVGRKAAGAIVCRKLWEGNRPGRLVAGSCGEGIARGDWLSEVVGRKSPGAIGCRKLSGRNRPGRFSAGNCPQPDRPGRRDENGCIDPAF
jgi:hypothetical protein